MDLAYVELNPQLFFNVEGLGYMRLQSFATVLSILKDDAKAYIWLKRY